MAFRVDEYAETGDGSALATLDKIDRFDGRGTGASINSIGLRPDSLPGGDDGRTQGNI